MEQLLKTVGLVASACQVTDISKLLPNREAQAEPQPSSSRRLRSPFSRSPTGAACRSPAAPTRS
jgi:hypothetical protein